MGALINGSNETVMPRHVSSFWSRDFLLVSFFFQCFAVQPCISAYRLWNALTVIFTFAIGQRDGFFSTHMADAFMSFSLT